LLILDLDNQGRGQNIGNTFGSIHR